MDSDISSVVAEEERTEEEYEDDLAEYYAILEVFRKYLEECEDEHERDEILEELMAMRADFLIHHAVDGFGMEMNEAMELVQKPTEELSEEEEERQGILLAAIDNLIDFAVAEEFQMSLELPEDWGDDEELLEECEGIFKKYNNVYASVENGDVNYAMMIAASWAAYSNQTILTYMTQGDNRVRPWHAALEGTTYKKSEFPAWLIPPIEYSCRCFLVEDSLSSIHGESKAESVVAQSVEKPPQLNPVYSESVCKRGRIFSAAHPYFKVPKKDKVRLKEIADRIKKQWLTKGGDV